MDHIAIMRKSWGLTRKIPDGRKKIESRWHSIRCRPWNGVKKGETIFFKDSGSPVALKARAGKVVQFSGLTPKKVREILEKYGENDGIEKKDIPIFLKKFKDKKYCILIFLKDPQEVEPFDIDKRGFGSMSSWVTVRDISEIKK